MEMEQPTDAGLTLENFAAAAIAADAVSQKAASAPGIKTEAELDAELDAELNAELTAEMTAGAAASSGDTPSLGSGGKEVSNPDPDPNPDPVPPNFRNFL